jgi:aldose 1-epimerase
MESAPASGRQFLIEAGPYRAAVASVGASLRELRHQGRHLVVPYAADEIRPLYRGAVLAPWPNRVIDGRYRLASGQTGPAGDRVEQLALSEPGRGHALHGLAGWLDFTVVERRSDMVSLSQVIEPQAGYPFRIALRVTYRLDAAAGLAWEVAAQNIGPGRFGAAPYGAGPHPYLVAGPSPLDEWRLTLPARSFIAVEGDRMLPAGLRDVAGGEFDFTSGSRLGPVRIDHAFGNVLWDGAHRATALLEDPSGLGVALTWDQASPWVQVHTADRPEPEFNRLGLALEPMTCPPDAFNTGADLICLPPGASHTVSWRIRAQSAGGR